MDAVILLSSRFYKVSLVLFFKYFYMETTKVKLNALFIALLPLLGSPVIHAETTAAPVLENRAAQGDITTPGGARRLSGDQTAALQASLINKPAKILFC
ncbi:Alkaline phosphatase [Raoultella ornithinolytica]|jgi:alkaline phosphatase|nr:Alkaline phosphatase [Raoultella ornithinolytica]